MYVLGIESSCDETAVAIYNEKHGLLAHALYSQIATHRQFGGVVPELASRDHVKYLIPLVSEALSQASLDKKDLDAIAYTAGPGLIGALLAGACFAKSLAYALNIKAIAVHHLEAHILAARLDMPSLQFPFIALLVSGGHTKLLLALAVGDYQILGDTLDDAVGEAFDKTAKVMGIPYPGGPMLAKIADSAHAEDTLKLPPFPRPMTNKKGLDFSFSGLKTHAMLAWHHSEKNDAARVGIACAFQTAVIDTLTIKCRRAIEQTGVKRLVIAGGVGANLSLRKKLTALMAELQGETFYPKIEFCTDNGAMIAYTGYLHLQRGMLDENLEINVKARWPLGSSPKA